MLEEIKQGGESLQQIQVHLNKDEGEILDRLIKWVEILKTNENIDTVKTQVLFEILEGLKGLKNYDSKEAHKKFIKGILKKLFMNKDLYKKFRKLLLLRERDRSLRESCIKALKKILKISKKIAPIMKQKKIHVIISFLIEREFKSTNVERERYQSMKFIEAWLEKSPNSFPILFAQVLVSISRNPEDLKLRKKAVEMLLTLCTLAPEIASNVGAIRLLIDSLVDLSLQGIKYEMISATILLLLNEPKTRVYFRHFLDLNKIFSIFTSVDGVDKDPKKEILDKIIAQMNLASKSIVNIMRNWNGVIYLSSSPLGLPSLVLALNQPTRLYKKISILDTFIDIFNVPMFIGGSEVESTGGAGGSGLSGSNSVYCQSENLLNNYIALLLQAFYHCGIYEALIQLGTTTDEGSELNKKSKFLLKKIMYLSSYLLPDVPHFPQLIQIATNFQNENHHTRTRATKMIKELSTIALKNPLELSRHNEIFGNAQQYTTKDFSQVFMKVYEYFNQMSLGLPFNTVISNYLMDLKMYYYSEIDDIKFNQKVKLAGVIQQKDYKKWNWHVINEILEGNLLTPARLEEVMKRTKFIKRILNFFLPSKQAFINMEWREENLIYARAGYNLIKTLLNSKEGKKALSSSPGVFFMFGLSFVENKDNIFHQRKSFLQDICDILEKEVNFLKNRRANYGKAKKKTVQQSQSHSNMHSMVKQSTLTQSMSQQQLPPGQGQNQQQIGATEDQRFFTKKRLNQTMFREYISWLGLFTNTKEGIKMLKQFKIYDHLMELVDNNGYYDHFCQIILQSFDYGSSGPSRKLLEAWVNKCSPNLAKSIVELFRMLFRSGLNDFYHWCLPILNKNIYSSNEEIASSAFDVLEEVCFEEKSLNQLLQVNERILDLQRGEYSDLFVAKFLRSQRGFQMLKDSNWLSTKLKEWKEKENQEYIVRLERSLFEGLTSNQVSQTVQQQNAMNIWIPIYEHSNDFRNELMVLKRYPFQLQIKIENMQNEVILQETLQTYVEADSNNQIQIVGKVVKYHSKLYGLAIENYYYIYVCVKLGNTYVDSKCNECKDPFWTISDVNDKTKNLGFRKNTFKVIKNGIHFVFNRNNPNGGEKNTSFADQVEEINRKIYLDQVIFKVQILPQKYKIIKTPIHLYGELVKTEDGANYLRNTQDIDYLKKEMLSNDIPLIRKRAALWAIGHIGSNDHGVKLINEADIIKDLVTMAQSAEILSIRGTCIYVLGLVSKTREGKKEISRLNWISSHSPGVSVCLPKDPSVLFKVQNYEFKGDLSSKEQLWKQIAAVQDAAVLQKDEQDIIKLISNLVNGVTEMQALNELRKLLDSKKATFMNPKIFEHVIILLSVYKFKPKARKFIFNLFEDLVFNDLVDDEVQHDF